MACFRRLLAISLVFFFSLVLGSASASASDTPVARDRQQESDPDPDLDLDLDPLQRVLDAFEAGGSNAHTHAYTYPQQQQQQVPPKKHVVGAARGRRAAVASETDICTRVGIGLSEEGGNTADMVCTRFLDACCLFTCFFCMESWVEVCGRTGS